MDTEKLKEWGIIGAGVGLVVLLIAVYLNRPQNAAQGAGTANGLAAGENGTTPVPEYIPTSGPTYITDTYTTTNSDGSAGGTPGAPSNGVPAIPSDLWNWFQTDLTNTYRARGATVPTDPNVLQLLFTNWAENRFKTPAGTTGSSGGPGGPSGGPGSGGRPPTPKPPILPPPVPPTVPQPHPPQEPLVPPNVTGTGGAPMPCPWGMHWDGNLQRCVADSADELPGIGGGPSMPWHAQYLASGPTPEPAWYTSGNGDTPKGIAQFFSLHGGWPTLAYHPNNSALLADAHAANGNNALPPGTQVYIPRNKIMGAQPGA